MTTNHTIHYRSIPTTRLKWPTARNCIVYTRSDNEHTNSQISGSVVSETSSKGAILHRVVHNSKQSGRVVSNIFHNEPSNCGTADTLPVRDGNHYQSHDQPGNGHTTIYSVSTVHNHGLPCNVLNNKHTPFNILYVIRQSYIMERIRATVLNRGVGVGERCTLVGGFLTTLGTGYNFLNRLITRLPGLPRACGRLGGNGAIIVDGAKKPLISTTPRNPVYFHNRLMVSV